MRQLLLVLTLGTAALFAQAPRAGGGGRGGPPKNLKVLKPEEVRAGMGMATAGLGLKCVDCHVAGDNSLDDKPEKLTARMMFSMTQEINAKFPDGKAHVTCFTCHQGQRQPAMAPPPAAPAQ